MNEKIQKAIEHRQDISKFIIHLTRNDKDTYRYGSTPKENLISILKEQEIKAFRHHCLFSIKLKEMSKEIRSEFKVACFTEVPLTQIHLLIQPIEGREIKLEPYGLVFDKNYFIKNGGQQALYLNSYCDNLIRDSADELFDYCMRNYNESEKMRRLLPFFNAMHKNYDFSWEREWRVLNGFKFNLQKLICLILPEDEEELHEKFDGSGIAVISPGWDYEKIVYELSRQQRKTKRYFLQKYQSIKEKYEKD